MGCLVCVCVGGGGGGGGLQFAVCLISVMEYSGGNATVIHWDITIIGELDDWGSTNVLELKAQCTTVHTDS